MRPCLLYWRNYTQQRTNTTNNPLPDRGGEGPPNRLLSASSHMAGPAPDACEADDDEGACCIASSLMWVLNLQLRWSTTMNCALASVPVRQPPAQILQQGGVDLIL